MWSSISEESLCELCGEAEIDGGCDQCGHHLCIDCYRYCDICRESVCKACDHDGLEELKCNKCGWDACLHGMVVGFKYSCTVRKCKGKLVSK